MADRDRAHQPPPPPGRARRRPAADTQVRIRPDHRRGHADRRRLGGRGSSRSTGCSTSGCCPSPECSASGLLVPPVPALLRGDGPAAVGRARGQAPGRRGRVRHRRPAASWHRPRPSGLHAGPQGSAAVSPPELLHPVDGRSPARSARCPAAASCTPSSARWSSSPWPPLFSVPLGIAAALFLAEVGGALARPVRTIVEAMTALPDIIAGLFIYAFLILTLGLRKSGFCAGAGARGDDDADRRARLRGRAADRPGHAARGLLRARLQPVAHGAGTWCCRPPGPGWPPRSCWRWPGASARPRRSCWSPGTPRN